MDVRTWGWAGIVTANAALKVLPPTMTVASISSAPAAMAVAVPLSPSAAMARVSSAGVVFVHVGGASGVGVVNIGWPFWSKKPIANESGTFAPILLVAAT